MASAPKQQVKTHTRTTASGKKTQVKQHARTGRKRRGIFSPGHAWRLAGKAFQAGRKRRRTVAIVLGVLAVGELLAWLTLSGIGLVLAIAGGLAIGVAMLAGAATGVELR